MGFDWEENGEVLDAPYSGIHNQVSELLKREMKWARDKAKLAFNKVAEEITRDTVANLSISFEFDAEGNLGLRIQEEFDFCHKFVSLKEMIDEIEAENAGGIVDDICLDGTSWIGNVRKGLAALGGA